MCTHNISHLKANYDSKTEKCLHFYSEIREDKNGVPYVWVKKCSSPYCNWHGKRERKQLLMKLRRLMFCYQNVYMASIHFRKLQDIELQNKIWASVKDKIEYEDDNACVRCIKHWKSKPKKSNPGERIYKRHLHPVWGSNEQFTHEQFKDMVTATLTKLKIPDASSYRVSLRRNSTVEFMARYLLRLRKKDGDRLKDDEFPPAWLQTWRMM